MTTNSIYQLLFLLRSKAAQGHRIEFRQQDGAEGWYDVDTCEVLLVPVTVFEQFCYPDEGTPIIREDRHNVLHLLCEARDQAYNRLVTRLRTTEGRRELFGG